jgi:hypothetical protein
MKTFNPTLGIALLTVSVALCACGGGGSSTSNSGIDWPATPSWPVSPTPTPPSPSPSPSPSVGTSNTVPIVVDQSMAGVNQPAVTITLCPPGTANTSQCVTVKNMLVDTGSVGVRVTSSALTDALKSQLLTQFGASGDKIGNAPIVQCAMFASGYTWGPIKRADVTIGSKKASNLPIQVIGDGGYTVPSDCMSRGGPNLGSLLGSHGNYAFNGIVGIGHSARDIATAAQTLIPATYYYCPSTNSCASTRVPLAKQVMNPVAAFSTNNNGTIIRLPALSAGGQASVTGELIFGVGTQQNNALPSTANVLPLDQNGLFTTVYKGSTLGYSAVDSGTNVFNFPDTSIPTAGGWYAPSAPLSLSASLKPTNGANTPIPVSLRISNGLNLWNSQTAATDSLGAPFFSGWFMWGLPFFYGRNVYTVLNGAKIGSQTGPFVAF